jgi:YD repeat-containing protein
MDRRGTTMAVAALCLALLALPAGAADGTLWYASDAAAFQGEPVAGPSGSDYVLEVTVGGSTETRILFRKGLEESRTIIVRLASGRRESLRIAGAIREERTYDLAGNLLEERFFPPATEGAEGGAAKAEVLPSETRRYAYASGRLRGVESLDTAGASQGRMEYRYDASGRLLELVTTGIFGSSHAGLAPGQGLPSAMWFSVPQGSDGELVDITRFDQAGRPLERSTWRKGLRLAQVLYGYDAAGKLASRTDRDLTSQRTAETSYDAAGRIILVVKTVEGREESREQYSYDGLGRLAVDEFRSPGNLRKVTYTYDAAGESSRAVTVVNGLIESIVIQLSDGSTRRELFDKGQLFLRALYGDGRLRKEEFIEGGTVVRTKDYP